jgi:hypothetical protein
MKYILDNNQLFKSIYNYIDSTLNNMWYGPGYDYGRDGETEDLIWFYTKDNEDWEFQYFTPEWYTRTFDGETREHESLNDRWLPHTPFIEFSTDSSFKQTMDNIFGEVWHPMFEKWFSDNFPDFNVKTFFYG